MIRQLLKWDRPPMWSDLLVILAIWAVIAAIVVPGFMLSHTPSFLLPQIVACLTSGAVLSLIVHVRLIMATKWGKR